MFNRKRKKAEVCLIALLSVVFMSALAFGQGAGAALTGVVQDPSGGVVTGAEVVARNVDTGVETRTTSNDRGSYTFPSLQVGPYEVTTNAAGFSAARSNVRLTIGAQARLDFNMTVAGSVETVKVTGAIDSVILEAGASTGTVMQEETMQAIPLLSNNVMDLINVMGGVTPATDPVFGAASQTFAGVAGGMINVTRDGMSVSEVRNPTGVAANTNINSEMIGEFRMVLSPVDAEMGRGAGQVQMTTRSGTNAFHGSAVWNVQNTALDARDFSAKRTNTPQSWRNMNDYMLTVSGPIVQNKTFFFATWEQQIARDKVSQNLKVLTPCARKGIYRYISDWAPAAVSADRTYSPTGTRTLQSVNPDGTPLLSGTFFNVNDSSISQAFTEGNTDSLYDLSLRIESVFGNLTDEARAALLADRSATGVYGDCSSLAFTPSLTGGTNTSGFYGPFNGVTVLQPNSYWGGDYVTGDAAGGVFRNAYDPTGFVDRFTYGADYAYGRVEMPPVNNYDMGDGLNYAGYRWHSPLIGSGGSIFGTGGDPDRKSFTVKIDHNAGNNHRISGTYTFETYFVNDAYRQWPEQYGGYGGSIERRPQNAMVSLTSTLAPTLLNEARFGLSLSDTWTRDPYDSRDGEKMRSVLETLLPREWANGEIPVVGVGSAPLLFHTDPQPGGSNPSHPFGSRGNIATTWGGSDPRWTIADTVTWMKGNHSFKGGVEYRRQSSSQEFVGNRGFAGGGSFIDHASAFGGFTADAGTRRGFKLAETGSAWTNMGNGWNNSFGSYSGNYSSAWALMSYYAGSINQVRQYFYGIPDTNSPTGSRWNLPYENEREFVYDLANQEMSLFFKDDWKVTDDLTLNLGVRYEYYGVPYARGGNTLRVRGNSAESAFGITQGGWNNWMTGRDQSYIYADPASITDSIIDVPVTNRPAPVTEYIYVGPDSPNPDVQAWRSDWNNFAPHIGFAWQLPWLGRGQTTLRGGWSISYSPVDNFNQYGIYVGDIGGVSRMESFNGVRGDSMSDSGESLYYMDLTDLRSLLPNGGFLEPSTTVLPLARRQVGEVNGFATVIDEDVRNPYVHSVNMSLTRNFGRSLTVDVRYIGTLAREQLVNTNLNASNYLQNGLYTELIKVRNGEESALINSLIPPNTLAAAATGSEQIRTAAGFFGTGGGAAPSTQANLISGNFNGIASTLATTNGNLVPLNGLTTSTAGLISRAGCLPEDRTGWNGDPATIATYPCAQGTPWNYFHTNPQYGSATMYYNGALTNYHSMQAQATLRPTAGLNFQVTYTWSRNMSDTGWTNYLGDRDYLLTGQHRSHTLNTYGTYELPMGSNGVLFRNATGAFKKAVEGWQLNWVMSLSSGAPASVTGATTLWGNSEPNLVRPDLWDEKSGKAVWSENFADGWYYGNRYTKTLDYNICNPAEMTGALFAAGCINAARVVNTSAPRALALSSGVVNPDTGEVLPARYSSLEEALRFDPHAMMEMDPATGQYTLMPSVVVFRSANQWDGENARGNYSGNRLTGQGRFSLDLAVSKSVEFMEGKRFEIRVDAQNVLNHATPTNGTSASYGGRFQSLANPAFAINNTAAFGRFNTKGGHRTFQARLALRF